MSMVTNRGNYLIFDIVSGGFVDIDQNSETNCSEGQQLLLGNNAHLRYTEKYKSACILNVTSLKYSCRSCAPGYVGLKRGTSRKLVVAYLVHYLPCSFAATCIENNIAVKPNFLGLSNVHTSTVTGVFSLYGRLLSFSCNNIIQQLPREQDRHPLWAMCKRFH